MQARASRGSGVLEGALLPSTADASSSSSSSRARNDGNDDSLLLLNSKTVRNNVRSIAFNEVCSRGLC